MRNVSLPALVAALAITAPAAAQDAGLGGAVQSNVAAMVVDPNPVHANQRVEGTTGVNLDGAVSRYRSGQVKPLIPLSGKSELGTQFATGAAAQTRGADGTGARVGGGQP